MFLIWCLRVSSHFVCTLYWELLPSASRIPKSKNRYRGGKSINKRKLGKTASGGRAARWALSRSRPCAGRRGRSSPRTPAAARRSRSPCPPCAESAGSDGPPEQVRRGVIAAPCPSVPCAPQTHSPPLPPQGPDERAQASRASPCRSPPGWPTDVPSTRWELAASTALSRQRRSLAQSLSSAQSQLTLCSGGAPGTAGRWGICGVHPPAVTRVPSSCESHKCVQMWPDVPGGGPALNEGGAAGGKPKVVQSRHRLLRGRGCSGAQVRACRLRLWGGGL